MPLKDNAYDRAKNFLIFIIARRFFFCQLNRLYDEKFLPASRIMIADRSQKRYTIYILDRKAVRRRGLA